MSRTPRHASFQPLARADARVLILGSLPGAQSLAEQRYYAYPHNQFWRLLGPVIGVDLVARDYDARLAAVQDARVAVWDVIASAERPGSLDSAIRNHEPNALADLIDRLPDLRMVAFNGATSAKLGRKALGVPANAGHYAATDGRSVSLVNLPSSSPAFAAMRIDDKAVRWAQLREALVR